MYKPVKYKFLTSFIFSILWAFLSFVVAAPWIASLATYTGIIMAYIIIFGIAIIPGFMNAFLASSLLMDKRPNYKIYKKLKKYSPPISIIIAAYNEQDSILSTLESIEKQDYLGRVEVIIVNDGSNDNTKKVLDDISYPWLKVIHLDKNAGKANALNIGLKNSIYKTIVTLDADCYLYKNSLKNLMMRYINDPDNTVAVAGEVLAKNSRQNFVTKIQEWDYFHGIAAVKRFQSLYQGTLVAQGAFSLYDKYALESIGGWEDVVGEDIVLTWRLLNKGWRVGFAEDACAFTNVPSTWKGFLRQRERWSRGLIEAFKTNWSLLFKSRLTTLFIWWNLMFPIMDIIYTFVFIPGIILALFGHFFIAGPMTLAVLPLAFLINYIMYNIQLNMFKKQGLKVRKNRLGFIAYCLCYGFILQPVCVLGYVKELFNLKKTWGTK